jgi:hypothetical protein
MNNTDIIKLLEILIASKKYRISAADRINSEHCFADAYLTRAETEILESELKKLKDNE